MFCKKCGKQINDGSLFCTECGAKQDICENQITEEKTDDNNSLNEDVISNDIDASAMESESQTNINESEEINSDANEQISNDTYKNSEMKNQQPVEENYNTDFQSFEDTSGNLQPKGVSFGKAIGLFFKNYFNFTGRAVRSEYWWAVLFLFLSSLIVKVISLVTLGILSKLYILFTFIPLLSLSIRRLHDIDKSWPWILLGLIPVAGEIILFVFFVTKSKPNNRWN